MFKKRKPLALIFVVHYWYYDVMFYCEDIFAFGGGRAWDVIKRSMLFYVGTYFNEPAGHEQVATFSEQKEK